MPWKYLENVQRQYIDRVHRPAAVYFISSFVRIVYSTVVFDHGESRCELHNWVTMSTSHTFDNKKTDLNLKLI